jgi:endonuclease/exonuclease/phosphatase family metal-dependent hydrolase
MKLLLKISALVFSLCLYPIAQAQDPVSVTLRVVSWNLESGEADMNHVARQLGEKRDVHLFGLSEVPSNASQTLERGAEGNSGRDYGVVLGTTGNQDRLMILFDQSRLELLGHEELRMIQDGNNGLRASLVGRFRGKTTGQEFLFMVNHLKRGGANNDTRIRQAQLLNQWATQQTLPVIACGDYNFDFDVDRGDEGPAHRDRGFDEMTRNGEFVWVRPPLLVKTNADDGFNTVLDFVFVANPPMNWFAESRILERGGDEAAVENDFDDSATESDHRPVDGLFTFGGNVQPRGPGRAPAGDTPVTAEELRRKIRALEAQVRQLKAQLRELEE